MRVPSLPPWAGPESRAAAAARALAGPALIVASVLFVLRDFAFGGMVSSQFRDVLMYWLPTYCFLGRTLAAGDVPGWNPLSMSGDAFAADPQSGWMYAPAMALFSVLPCDVAISEYIVLQPILAGLGVYAFLRTEGLSRSSATVGGLAMALGLSAGRDVVAIPYTAALAWTAVALAACARYFRAETWAGRLVWAAVTALAWGQIAAAHLTQGLLLGSAALGIYVAVRAFADAVSRRRAVAETLAVLGLLGIVLVPLNLAFFLPRLPYMGASTLGLGYERLITLGSELSGQPVPEALAAHGLRAGWPLTLASSPGRYLGAIPLVLSFAALWSRRHRSAMVALVVFGTLTYALSTGAVVRWLEPRIGSSLLAETYLRGPHRLAVGLVLVIAVLGAIGLEAWREERPLAARAAILIPGIVVWGALWPVAGIDPARMGLIALAAAAAVPILAAVAVRPALAVVVPVALTVELSANVAIGLAYGPPIEGRPPPAAAATGESPLLEPDVDAARWLTPGPIARAIARGEGRFAWLSGQAGGSQVGQSALPMERFRMQLFGLEEAEGYDPVQNLRYWTFLRKYGGATLQYNRSFVRDLPPRLVLDLLQISWIVTGTADRLPRPWTVVAREGPWMLYRGPGVPRASLFRAWTAVPAGRALGALPSDVAAGRVVLEADPGIPSGPAGEVGSAQIVAEGPQELEIAADAPAPSLVVVRNVFDPNWHATVDGRPAPVMPANHVLQAVPVPAGRHTVRLWYEDPWIGRGLVASGATLAALLAAAAALAWRGQRRGAPIRPEPTPGA